jgi:hypothetical protein
MPFLGWMSVSDSPVPRFSLGSPWQDALALGGLLALMNLWTAWADPGWLSMNPSPWILLPLLIGARYGFRWGFLAGTVGSLGLLVVLLITSEGRVAGHALFFLALPTIGFLAGEAHALFASRLAGRDDTVEVLTTQSDHPGADLEVAEDARGQLQERLAMLHADTASLDQQLRGLFEPGAGPVFPHLLQLLRETAGVTDAAFYQIEGILLTRQAVLGASEALPDQLALAEADIANLAVTRQSLVTCRQVWSTVPAQSSPWLAALPWPVASGPARHLLLIHRMEFQAVNWRIFSRIQMICRWVAQFMTLRNLDGMTEPAAGPLVVAPDVFRRAAAEAAAAQREHNLPSATLTFRLARGSSPEQSARLVMLIAPQMRTTDLATQYPDGTVEVLLTFDGPRDASRFQQRVLGVAARDPLLQGRLAPEMEELSARERIAA